MRMSADPGGEGLERSEDTGGQNVELGQEIDTNFRAEGISLDPQESGNGEVPGWAVQSNCDHSSFETEISRLKKELELANRAKETTVMRYAKSEQEVIRKRNEAEGLEKQLKASLKENEYISKKNKLLSSERERLMSLIDSKGCEVQTLKKELEKLQDDNSGKEFQLKWTQSKLQGEVQAHKETSAKLEKCTNDLKEALDHVQHMREECGETICTSESPENSNVISPSDSVIAKSDVSSSNAVAVPESLVKEMDSLKSRHRSLIEENNSLSCKVQNLEVSRLDQEQKITRLQEVNASYLNQLGTLKADLSAAEAWKSQFEKVQERVSSIQSECEQLRNCNAELLSDMAICREKEAELLAYTQQVTDKNVHLQSQFSALEAQSLVITEENGRLRGIIAQWEKDLEETQRNRMEEKRRWTDVESQFSSSLEDRDALIQNIQAKLDEARGEIALLKKKHEVAIKELRKELEQTIKQRKEESGMSSRTSSSTSLNQVELGKSPDGSQGGLGTNTTTPSINESPSPQLPDQQAFVERIVKLQRALAKKDEKIEFLQEHSKQLLEGIKLKSKIIQAYAMNQETGALTTDVLPHHKYTLEMQLSSELAKKGGLPRGQPGDDTMTLELSLDINRKLQAVLEDSLLKNITLKESMRTLGSEVCRLTEFNKELTGKLQGNRCQGNKQ